MKRKITTWIMVIAMMTAAVVPASAASLRCTSSNCETIWQMLCNWNQCGQNTDSGCQQPTDCPTAPQCPEYPQTPEYPEFPEYPDMPEQPEIPEQPETPDEPETPEQPDEPEAGDSMEMQVVELVNEARAAYGLQPLSYSAELSEGARLKSQDMSDNGYFDHNSPTYGTPFQMMKQLGISYQSAGENIAKGYTSAEAVVNAWMNSEGHRANILNKNYTQIGVGYDADGNYWTQWFRSV